MRSTLITLADLDRISVEINEAEFTLTKGEWMNHKLEYEKWLTECWDLDAATEDLLSYHGAL